MCVKRPDGEYRTRERQASKASEGSHSSEDPENTDAHSPSPSLEVLRKHDFLLTVVGMCVEIRVYSPSSTRSSTGPLFFIKVLKPYWRY